jgi:protein gp37
VTAEKQGTHIKVFPSLCDPFDNQVPGFWRHDHFRLMHDTPHLLWLLLTKRPQNIAKMLHAALNAIEPSREWPWDNVWIGCTAENQDEADRRIPALLSVQAKLHFISAEPLLSHLAIRRWLAPVSRVPTLGWVITGFESGRYARETDLKWVRDLRDQCVEFGTPFFFKQSAIGGRKIPTPELDGRRWTEFPH